MAEFHGDIGVGEHDTNTKYNIHWRVSDWNYTSRQIVL